MIRSRLTLLSLRSSESRNANNLATVHTWTYLHNAINLKWRPAKTKLNLPNRPSEAPTPISGSEKTPWLLGKPRDSMTGYSLDTILVLFRRGRRHDEVLTGSLLYLTECACCIPVLCSAELRFNVLSFFVYFFNFFWYWLARHILLLPVSSLFDPFDVLMDVWRKQQS